MRHNTSRISSQQQHQSLFMLIHSVVTIGCYRTCHMRMYMRVCSTLLHRKSLEELPFALEKYRLLPTIICGVTRIFERICNGIQKKLSEQPFFARALFSSAYNTKYFLTHYLRIRHVPVFDRIFDSICEALGGCVRLFVCGGAALPEEIQPFLRVCCRASFLQGYGLTEITSSVCAQTS